MRSIFLLFLFTNLIVSKDLLWKVESETAVVYITGSIHMGADQLYPLPESVESAFEESDYLALEVHMDSLSTPNAIMKIANISILKDGSTLKDHVSEQTYKTIKVEFSKLGIPPLMYDNMTPWAAGMLITQTRLQNEGFNASQGIDNYFFDKAKESQKIVLQLESVDEQIEVFKKLDEFGEDFLSYSILSTEETIKLFDQMVEAWKNADLQKLDELLNSGADTKGYEKMLKILLDDRNRRMINGINNYLSTTGTYFIVVGAGHLSGKTGLINYFKTRNYKINQL